MEEDNTQIRKHIRHITGIPVEVRIEHNESYQAHEDIVTNVSLGGLSFIANDRLEMGQPIKINFPVFGWDVSLSGKVVWCEKTGRGYEVGLEFDDIKEVERLKLIEQTCQIESFRKQIEEQEGRKLSVLEATREWASQYAGDFSAVS